MNLSYALPLLLVACTPAREHDQRRDSAGESAATIAPPPTADETSVAALPETAPFRAVRIGNEVTFEATGDAYYLPVGDNPHLLVRRDGEWVSVKQYVSSPIGYRSPTKRWGHDNISCTPLTKRKLYAFEFLDAPTLPEPKVESRVLNEELAVGISYSAEKGCTGRRLSAIVPVRTARLAEPVTAFRRPDNISVSAPPGMWFRACTGTPRVLKRTAHSWVSRVDARTAHVFDTGYYLGSEFVAPTCKPCDHYECLEVGDFSVDALDYVATGRRAPPRHLQCEQDASGGNSRTVPVIRSKALDSALSVEIDYFSNPQCFGTPQRLQVALPHE